MKRWVLRGGIFLIPGGVDALKIQGCKFNTPAYGIRKETVPKVRFYAQGIRVEYFLNMFKLTKTEEGTYEQPCDPDYYSIVDFDWGEGEACGNLGADDFSLRISGMILIPSEGNYKICLESAGSAPLYMEDGLIIDAWDSHYSLREDCNYGDCNSSMSLSVGVHPFVILYYNEFGPAAVKLGWGSSCDGSISTFEPIPASNLVVVRKDCPKPPKPLSKRIVGGCTQLYPSGSISFILTGLFLLFYRETIRRC